MQKNDEVNKSENEAEKRPEMNITAQQYLTCWSTDKDNWKFNKKKGFVLYL